ncbi:MAG: prepilin-type N-terminal cleavage/methylation domain-containing protein [Gemmatimonadaceae bacterium]
MQSCRAFTLVEVLVALVLTGVAAVGLVTALTGDHRLRAAAAAHSFAAGRARERLDVLAMLPCSGDASGATTSVWGVERWRAQASPPVWRLTDSIVPRPLAGAAVAPVVIVARIACPR